MSMLLTSPLNVTVASWCVFDVTPQRLCSLVVCFLRHSSTSLVSWSVFDVTPQRHVVSWCVHCQLCLVAVGPACRLVSQRGNGGDRDPRRLGVGGRVVGVGDLNLTLRCYATDRAPPPCPVCICRAPTPCPVRTGRAPTPCPVCTGRAPTPCPMCTGRAPCVQVVLRVYRSCPVCTGRAPNPCPVCTGRAPYVQVVPQPTCPVCTGRAPYVQVVPKPPRPVRTSDHEQQRAERAHAVRSCGGRAGTAR